MIDTVVNPLIDSEHDTRAQGYASLSANELTSVQGDEDLDDDDEYEEPL